MAQKISSRLLEIVDALGLKPGMRILEIGCGPGAMAREMAKRVSPGGYVLAIDRSARAISQAKAGSTKEIKSGLLSFRIASAEQFKLLKNEKPFDMAVAIRVGAFDGRFPDLEEVSYRQIKKSLKKNAKLLIDGGDPLKEFKL